MLKLQIQVRLIKMQCNEVPKVSSSFIVQLQNQGQCITRGEKKIQSQSRTVQLDELPELQMFLVVDELNRAINPFTLLCSTQQGQQNQNKIILHADRIVRQYVEDINNPMVSTLQLSYCCELGQLFYRVTILNAQKIEDELLVNRFSNRFSQIYELDLIILNRQSSEINLHSELGDIINPLDSQPNNLTKQNSNQTKQLTPRQMNPTPLGSNATTPEERSEKEFQTAFGDHYHTQNQPHHQMQTSMKRVQWQSEQIKSYLKYPVYVSEKQSSRAFGIKLKLLILLLIIGLCFLLFNQESGKVAKFKSKLSRHKSKKRRVK